MNRTSISPRRMAALAVLFVVAGACGVAAVRGFREAERNRRTFETGRRAPAKVVSARVSEGGKLSYKVFVKSVDYFLSLELEGAAREFQVDEREYRNHPIGSVATAAVDGGGTFLPEFRREALVGGGKAWVQMALGLVCGLAFLLLLAGTLVRPTSPGTRCL